MGNPTSSFPHPLCGYDTFEHLGALNPGDPSILSILGAATNTVENNGLVVLSHGATFSLVYMRFLSEAGANHWSHFRLQGVEYPFLPAFQQGPFWYRNIQNYPDDLGYAAGQVFGDVISLSYNLRTESGSYLLQGPGSIQISPSGYYLKEQSGYHRVASAPATISPTALASRLASRATRTTRGAISSAIYSLGRASRGTTIRSSTAHKRRC